MSKLKITPPKFLILVLLTLLATLIGCGNKSDVQKLINEKISNILARDATSTEAMFLLEKKAAEGGVEKSMDLSQLYELYNQSINQRMDMLVELRGFHPEVQYELRSQVADYLNNENTILRAQQLLMESYVAFLHEDFDLMREKIKSADTTEQKRRILSDYQKSASDLASKADGLITAYQSLVLQESILLGKLSEAEIRFNPVFSIYQDSNIKQFKSMRDQAASMSN